MSTATKLDSAPASSADSPFLQTSHDELPSLTRICVPTSAVAEFSQQMSSEVVNLPIPRNRCPTRIRTFRPSKQCAPAFVYAFNGFCSARRAINTPHSSEAESMLVAESLELIAHGKNETGKHGSVSPRGLSVSLVVPPEANNNTNTLSFIDGFAALSDSKLADKIPIATRIRYNIYGGSALLPVSKLLVTEAFDNKEIDGIGLLVRWFDSGCDSVRTEFTALGSVHPSEGEAARCLQLKVVEISASYGISLPAEFFWDPPKSEDGYFEKQICSCADEFRNVIHKEEPFVPSKFMRISKRGILKRVPGCFARLSPISLGLDGVTSPDVIHAILAVAFRRGHCSVRSGRRCRPTAFARNPRGDCRSPICCTASFHTGQRNVFVRRGDIRHY